MNQPSNHRLERAVKPGRRSGQIVRPLNLIVSGHVRFPCSTSALSSMHTSRLVVVLLLAPKPPRA